MLNILDIIFLNLAVSVTVTGYLINHFESYIPVVVIKIFKYGSFAYEGPEANFLQVIEIPKAYYRHFYLFASLFSAVTLGYMFLVYYVGFAMNSTVPAVLSGILQQNEPTVSATAAFLALSLLTLQCWRRFYETYYLQVFAKSSKMNLSHYLSGIVHYFACIVAAVGEAPLFCGPNKRDTIRWTDEFTTVMAVPCILIFLCACFEQYQTNIIFANLRKDKKTGVVVTEEHRVPNGRLFKFVSSPHRLCEIIMYSILTILVPTTTFFCIYLWVLSNQIQTAIQAHEWYKKTFKNYPTNRFAVIPLLI